MTSRGWTATRLEVEDEEVRSAPRVRACFGWTTSPWLWPARHGVAGRLADPRGAGRARLYSDGRAVTTAGSVSAGSPGPASRASVRYFSKHPYLPRLRDKRVLTDAIADVMTDVSWVQTGFALATCYDPNSGEFAGLAIPNEDDFGTVNDDTYLVPPHAAQAQRQREEAAAEEAAKTKKAADGGSDSDGDDESTTTEPPRSTTATPELKSVKNGRYRARFEVDTAKPDAMGESAKQAIDEVLRHIAAAEGAENVEIVPDVRAENSSGSGENVVCTVKENSRVLGFDVSEFEDVEW